MQSPIFSLLLLFLPLASSLDVLLRSLKKYHPDWEPQAIVDIGANRGKWSTAAREHYPNAKILMLEATPVHGPTLVGVASQIGNAEHQINILSGKTGDTVDWFEGGDTTGNSMFRENTKFYANAQANKRNTITLDDAVKNSHIKKDNPVIADMIKIDVQGAELLVLEGASQTLAEATFVQVEVSVIEYNKGGACMWEVDEAFRSHGFYLYEMDEFLRNTFLFKTKGIGQYDALYVRPTSNRLPPSFANCTYCGFGRERKTNNKQAVAEKVQETKSQKTKSLESIGDNCMIDRYMAQLQGQNPLVLAFACFCLGLLMGRWTNSVGGKKSPRSRRGSPQSAWFSR